MLLYVKFEIFLRFSEQKAPHNLKPEYWVVLLARPAFVLVFAVTVISLKMLVIYH